MDSIEIDFNTDFIKISLCMHSGKKTYSRVVEIDKMLLLKSTVAIGPVKSTVDNASFIISNEIRKLLNVSLHALLKHCPEEVYKAYGIKE